MNSPSKGRQSQSKARELIVTGAALIVVGAVGWLVYDRWHRLVDSIPLNWKTARLRYEGTTFRYPPTWKLTSAADDGTYQQTDDATLTGSDGFVMSISNNVNGAGHAEEPSRVVGRVALRFLGNSGYLDWLSEDRAPAAAAPQYDDLVDGAALSQSPTDLDALFPSRAIGLRSYDGRLRITAGYANADGSGRRLTVRAANTDPNYRQARLVIESFMY